MSRRAGPRKRRPWPLKKLVADRPSAPAVWLALCELSDERGSLFITPTRAKLSEMTGYNAKTISAALTALEDAAWIWRSHAPVNIGNQRVATLLRIVLRRSGRSTPSTEAPTPDGPLGRSTPLTEPPGTPSNNGDFCIGRSTPSTVTVAVEGVKRPKGKGRLAPQYSPTGSRSSGAPPGPPPPLTLWRGPGTPPDDPGWCSTVVDPHSNPCDSPMPPESEQQPAAVRRLGGDAIDVGIEKIIASIGIDAFEPDTSAPGPASGPSPAENT